MRGRSLPVLKNDEVIDFLIENGIIDVIESIRKRIEEKIIEWDLTVKRKKSNIDDILN